MREEKFYKFRNGNLVELKTEKMSRQDISAMVFCLFLALAILTVFVILHR